MMRSPQRNKTSVCRRCFYFSLAAAFYVAIFLNTLGWHDKVRRRFASFSSSDFGQMAVLLAAFSDDMDEAETRPRRKKSKTTPGWAKKYKKEISSSQQQGSGHGGNKQRRQISIIPMDANEKDKEFVKVHDRLTMPPEDAGKESTNKPQNHVHAVKTTPERLGKRHKHNSGSEAKEAAKLKGGRLTKPPMLPKKDHSTGKVSLRLEKPQVKRTVKDKDTGRLTKPPMLPRKDHSTGKVSMRLEKLQSSAKVGNTTRAAHKQNKTAHERPFSSETTTSLGASSTIITKDDAPENRLQYSNDDTIMTSNKKVTLSDSITPESPVFVFSLPNNGGVSIQRYFQCAGLDEESLGRRYTKRDLYATEYYKRRPIGKCIRHNTRMADADDLSSFDPLENCGGYRVWTEIDYISKSTPREMQEHGRQCYFPTLRYNVVDKLLTAYPNATVINVIRDPSDWYETLSSEERERWFRWCNLKASRFPFPEPNAPKEEWTRFYVTVNSSLRKHMRHMYPHVKFLEIDLEVNTRGTAGMLNEHLGIPETCWMDHAVRKDRRPRDIRYPVFVAALPKSATSTAQSYLNCGMGAFEGVHQWTQREGTTKDVTIGECMQDNIKNNRSIVEGCGDHKHWSDMGVLRKNNCFYPSIHGGLEAIYQAHPFGTIMNTVRDAKSWYKSAKRWEGLLLRWSTFCEGFPPVGSRKQEWMSFYNQHNQKIRDFAKAHPTMTYVEIHVDNKTETNEILSENFGFPSRCWGHENSNANNSLIMRHRAIAAARENQTVEEVLEKYYRKMNITRLPDSGNQAQTEE
ncbi:expressed unknown protein [Seminavis robusta]|uniref:Sulfotransferase domain-containing protein n=1 Tax=Seminavis robusta TaxID=568900 RepID=A0A9N8E727_9STRA|nr:expressed unknown protein [Seminavis robusta]|eukprot:Sro619_g176490.1 n/a (799) ;mRNA; r:41219-43699